MSAQSCLILCKSTPRTVACQAPLSMVFLRQEYWSGLPFPLPGDLPNLGTEPTSPASPELQADSSPLTHWALKKFLAKSSPSEPSN